MTTQQVKIPTDRDVEMRVEDKALEELLSCDENTTPWDVVEGLLLDRAKQGGRVQDPEGTVSVLVADARARVEAVDNKDRRAAIFRWGLQLNETDLTALSILMSYQETCYDPSNGIMEIEAYAEGARRIVERFSDKVYDPKKAADYSEIFTPTWVVNEMLDELPEEVWSDPDLKWLDPCCGPGAFMVQVIRRLMRGLESWQADPVQRYKHIVENMVHQVDVQARSLLMNMYMLEPAEWLDLNVFDDSFLEDGFLDHARDVWGVEKFDVVLGNPPYNTPGDPKKAKVLYDKFIVRAHDIVNPGGYVSMINPSKWTTGGKGLDRFRQWALTSQDLVRLKHFVGDDSVFPSVSIMGGVSYSLFKKGAGAETVSYTCAHPDEGGGPNRWIEETVEVSPSEYDIFPTNLSARRIINTVLSNKLGRPHATSAKLFGPRTFYFNKK